MPSATVPQRSAAAHSAGWNLRQLKYTAASPRGHAHVSRQGGAASLGGFIGFIRTPKAMEVAGTQPGPPCLHAVPALPQDHSCCHDQLRHHQKFIKLPHASPHAPYQLNSSSVSSQASKQTVLPTAATTWRSFLATMCTMHPHSGHSAVSRPSNGRVTTPRSGGPPRARGAEWSGVETFHNACTVSNSLLCASCVEWPASIVSNGQSTLSRSRCPNGVCGSVQRGLSPAVLVVRSCLWCLCALC